MAAEGPLPEGSAALARVRGLSNLFWREKWGRRLVNKGGIGWVNLREDCCVADIKAPPAGAWVSRGRGTIALILSPIPIANRLCG